MGAHLFKVSARSGLPVGRDERHPGRSGGGPYRPANLGEDFSRLVESIADAFAFRESLEACAEGAAD